jgi:hypothetical protein
MRQLSAAANAQHIAQLTAQTEALRQAKLQSVEELAAKLEPLAQALAALTDDTRQTLTAIQDTSRAGAEAVQAATQKAQTAAGDLTWATQGLEWRHYILTILTGLSTAVLVSGFWLWLSPPQIDNRLSAQDVADLLQPALIEAVQPCTATPPR